MAFLRRFAVAGAGSAGTFTSTLAPTDGRAVDRSPGSSSSSSSSSLVGVRAAGRFRALRLEFSQCFLAVRRHVNAASSCRGASSLALGEESRVRTTSSRLLFHVVFELTSSWNA